MASLSSGNQPVLAETNGQSASTPEPKNPCIVGTKRKAEHETEENKENARPESASKSRKLDVTGKQKIDHTSQARDDEEATKDPKAITEGDTKERREHTPGRDGPIKEEWHLASPDIKPFKGPPGKKVRKTAHEKNEEYKQFIRENEGHMFHELYVCFDKGPNGSPTYDKSGFQLDYYKVADWMKPTPYNKSKVVKGMERTVARMKTESEQMAEIFFEKGEAPTDTMKLSSGNGYWKDRVSKDLNVPWHKITVEHFKEWEKKGFKKARRGEYENPTEEERKRMLRLMNGASLRK
ncbi:hypothetical protein IFR04_012506 [Cadophora malorum]|uniref:Uncharacterized protein n=1 Tax=Cadophora malorum TaxID=108018 RepID=A0A8H7T6J7_9HELO|nr:hypothetical protein IFR04_012506 [Cadophora malorum]